MSRLHSAIPIDRSLASASFRDAPEEPEDEEEDEDKKKDDEEEDEEGADGYSE
jgi:hypothetical protein